MAGMQSLAQGQTSPVGQRPAAVKAAPITPSQTTPTYPSGSPQQDEQKKQWADPWFEGLNK